MRRRGPSSKRFYADLAEVTRTDLSNCAGSPSSTCAKRCLSDIAGNEAQSQASVQPSNFSMPASGKKIAPCDLMYFRMSFNSSVVQRHPEVFRRMLTSALPHQSAPGNVKAPVDGGGPVASGPRSEPARIYRAPLGHCLPKVVPP